MLVVLYQYRLGNVGCAVSICWKAIGNVGWAVSI